MASNVSSSEERGSRNEDDITHDGGYEIEVEVQSFWHPISSLEASWRSFQGLFTETNACGVSDGFNVWCS